MNTLKAATVAIAAAAIPAFATPALAQGAGHGQVILAQAGGCPPGLAKKRNGCTPPGLAKKRGGHRDGDRHHDRDRVYYDVGDRIGGDYVVIRDPSRYGLDPARTYYRVDNQVFRVDRDTREVMEFVGAMAALLD